MSEVEIRGGSPAGLLGDLASLRIERVGAGSRRRRWPLWVLAPALLGLGAAYASRWFPAVRSAQAAPPVTTVVAPQATAAVLTASGYVVARRKAVVSAKIQGRLAELTVEEGSRVREGQILARLDSADALAQVARAKAQEEGAEAGLEEYRRQLRLAEGLAREGIIAADALGTAQSRVAVASATVAQAKADLEWSEALYQNTLIRAPFTGTVVKKMAEIGESVAPIPPGINISTSSGAVVALADLETLEVEADVSETSVATLSARQPAEVTVEAFPDRRYRAVLRQVIPTADRTKATVQVKVTILEKDPALRPEMSAKVTFLDRRDEVKR